MKNISLCFWGIVIVLSGLWWLAEPLGSAPAGFLALRASLLNYTGIIAIGVISVALILAARPPFFEPLLGGLVDMYRLHRWLGCTALLMAISHWLSAQAPKWLVGVGWLEQPLRPRSPEPSDGVQQFFANQRGLAETVGEWAFYAAVLLIVLALVKRFPYRHFFSTHRLLAVVYLPLVFHSVVLMNPAHWREALAPVLFGLMMAGTTAAVAILWRSEGPGRRMVGVVERLTRDEAGRIVEVAIQLKGRWGGHQVGQFAFVSLAAKEGPQPLTITSAWQGDGRLLGVSETPAGTPQALPASLRPGDLVKVQGPFGQFSFVSNKARQIWIAGGIGITPFIARLRKRAKQSDGKIVDLFYCTLNVADDDEAIDRLRRDALKAKVKLHLHSLATDGPLSAQRIEEAVTSWRSSEIWFCGQQRCGRDLRREFRARGLRSDDFHQELFDAR